MSGGAVARVAISAIEVYRTMISPLRPASCRFTPTCSQYAVDALREFGVWRGSWLLLVRLAKCGPWHRGGWDPIPERRELESRSRSDFDESMADESMADGPVAGATLRSDSFV